MNADFIHRHPARRRPWAGVRVGLVLSCLAGSISAAQALDSAAYSIGSCGGIMTGYNGRQYPCGADRRPVCEHATSRCVCLETTDCGGKRNEPF